MMNMMKTKQALPLAATLLLATTISAESGAGERWYTSTAVSTLGAIYSGSQQRNSQISNSLLLSADYLDDFGIALSYNRATIDFKPVNGIDSDIDQTAIAARLHYRLFSDAVGGSLTPQITLHSISNNDTTGLSDGVTAIAPKLAYLNNRRSLYLDLEYTTSRYPNNGDLAISQWASTIGFTLGAANWLSITPYLIQSSDSTLTLGEERFSSVKVDWRHWFGPDAPLGLHQLSVGLMGGKRLYAVDNASFALYNLADRQEGSLQIGATWRPAHGLDISALIGTERYTNIAIDNTYHQNYLYLALAKQW